MMWAVIFTTASEDCLALASNIHTFGRLLNSIGNWGELSGGKAGVLIARAVSRISLPLPTGGPAPKQTTMPI